MSELKFRVWCIPKKEMFEAVCIYYDGGCKRFPDSEYFNHNETKIMQFTGLKDINGKEIYEGDIVKTKNINGVKKSSKGIWKVIWNKYSTGFDGELISNEENDTGEEFECLGNFRDYRVEIIGNIYENPELLSDVKHATGGGKN